MQINPEIIKKHFQKSIDNYIDNAVVQRIMADRLVDNIKGKTFDKVLEIGAGAGLLTKRIAGSCKFNSYISNDLVETSEMYVKKYISDARFICGDFREILIPEKFDLIASNAVFQWFENLDEVFFKCSNLLNEYGWLIFSTFAPDNFKEFKDITGLSLKYKTEQELIRLLKSNFEIIKLEKFEYAMNFNTPIDILAHMKNTGVNSLSKTGWSIKDIRNFCDKYMQKFSKNTLTYSPIIVIAKLK